MPPSESDLCLCCDEPCLDAEGLSCTECCYRYHFGKCSNVSENTFKSKGESWKKSWRCATCRSGQSRSVQENKPKNQADLATLLVALNEKVDGLATLKDTVESIEKSVQLMSNQYDEILIHMRRQDKEIGELKKRVEKIERQENACDAAQFMREVDQLEWQSRKLNLEFHGIPVSENENLMSKVNEVARKIKVPELTDNDVVTIHRLPAAKDKVPGILVRLGRQSLKEAFLKQRKELNTLNEQCHILENLTKRNRTLLANVKDWARTHGFKYVWHRNGNVYVRQKDGDNAINVRHENDLDKLG